MIEVSQLVKKYGERTAIEDVSFQVKKGEVLGFLGPNGAGKSTTMKIITGYMSPTSGQVSVGGEDVFENPIAVKRKIGYLPETPPVYGEMRVQNYLRFVAELKGCETASLDRLVGEAIEKTHLKEVESRLIQNLSKGFRQRVGIAQALVSNPEILILDEPTVGLDPKQVAEIRKLILSLKGDHTIILSTHILPGVQVICDRIVIINNGKLVAEDSPQNIGASATKKVDYLVRLARPSSQVIDTLRSSPFIHKIDQTQVGINISMDSESENVEKLSEQLVSSGAGLLEFKCVSDSLEDMFISLTSENEEHP